MFQEGQSSNLGLSRGVWQVVLARNNSRRSGVQEFIVDKSGTEQETSSRHRSPGVRLDWTMSDEGLPVSKSWALPSWGRELCIKSGWLPVRSPHGLDPCAPPDRSL